MIFKKNGTNKYCNECISNLPSFQTKNFSSLYLFTEVFSPIIRALES